MFYYSLTIKKRTYPNFIHFYEEFITRFEQDYFKKYSALEYHYEDTFGFHMHAMLCSEKYFPISRIWSALGDRGYKVDFKPTRILNAWNHYIVKDRKGEEKLINEQYAIQNACPFVRIQPLCYIPPFETTNDIIRRTVTDRGYIRLFKT